MKTVGKKIFNICSVVAFLAAVVPCATEAANGYPSTRVSVNARNVDLNDLIAVIADQANMNISLEGVAQARKATLRLTNVPVEVAVRTIEHSYGLQEVWENGVLHLGTAEAITRGYPTSSSISERIINVSNADPGFIASTLSNTLPTGTIVVPDQRANNVLIKGSPAAVASAVEIIKNLDRSRYGNTSFTTVHLPINNIRATDAVQLIRNQIGATAGQGIVAENHSNAIVATGSPELISEVKGILFNVDRPGRQVRFKVRVSDVTPLNESSNIGVLFGGVTANSAGTQNAGSASTATVFANKTLPINATLNFLVSQGRATILAEPDISTLENEKATLNVGEQYPITFFNPQTGQNQVQFINAGVDLTVTPIIGQNDDVTVTLDTDYSQILSFVGTYPIVGQRHVTNVMRVGSDQTIVIAGLFQDITNETVQKVPILGDIPIIGQVFRNRSATHTRDEIVFLITPHVLNSTDFHPASDVPPEPK